MTSYSPKPEMTWRPDPQVDAARKLPDWAEFHRICGRSALYFDHIERAGRGNTYRCVAWTAKRSTTGSYPAQLLHTGEGQGVVAALRAAFEGSGVAVPQAAALLERDLAGEAVDEFAAIIAEPTPAPIETAAVPLEDEFADL